MKLTRKDKVRRLLETARREQRVFVDDRIYECVDGWVKGYLFIGPTQGGSEGMRRLRELRTDDGIEIEMRTMKDRTTHEYRLAPAKPVQPEQQEMW